MGGTNIKAGLVEDGYIVRRTSIPSHSSDDFASTISRVDELIGSLLSTEDMDPGSISGIGFAVPGIVDVDRNLVLDINEKFTGARSFDFNRWHTGTKHGGSLVMENDARAALVGEWKHGRAMGYNHVVMVTLGTGVGGAAMINGRLLYGKNYQAGCLGGHFTVNYDGNRCTCGNTGCVEAEASSWALNSLIEQNRATGDPTDPGAHSDDQDTLDFREIFRRVKAGDASAKTISDHCLKVWSAGIVSMIHAYDPEIVVISGGIMQSSDLILPYIRDWVERNAWMPASRVRIESAQHINDAALLGMSWLTANR